MSSESGFPGAARWATALAAVLLVAGCAAPANDLKRQAQDSARKGDWATAIARYEQSLAAGESDTELRTSLALARNAYSNALMTSAQRHLRDADFEAAESQVRQAQSIVPSDAADQLLQEIGDRRRLSEQLLIIEQLIAGGHMDEARGRVGALSEKMPRDPRITELLRRLEPPAPATALQTATLAYPNPVSIQFRDSGLRTVFEFLTRTTGVNFVLDKDLKDMRTSINAQQVSMDEVLHMLLVSNQLEKRVLGPNTLLIYPATQAKQRENQELVVKAFYLAHADPKQTLALIKTMVKTRDVHIDEKLNLLVLRDTPEAIRMAERLIAYQDRAEPEVLLEVEVLEVQRNNLNNLGIQWPDGIAVATPAMPLTELRTLNSSRISVSGLSAGLNFRRQDLQADVLANPMIRVRNRERARIHIGDRIPLLTATASATGGFVSESVQYVDVGVRLEVEPEVSVDQIVGIKVSLEVSSLGTRIQTNSGSVVFQIGSRSATTALRLRDGETQLLAGLISDQERNAVQSVPLLGRIPAVGWLFRNNDRTRTKTEIVLAITPRIVRSVEQPGVSSLQFWSGTEGRISDRPPGWSAPGAGEGPRLKTPTIEKSGADALQAPKAAPGDNSGDQTPPVRSSSGASVGDGSPSGGSPVGDSVRDLPDAARLASEAGTVPRKASARPATAPFARKIALRWEGPPAAKPGEVITLSLKAQGMTALKQLPFQIGFDAGAMTLEGIEAGDWLTTAGGAGELTRTAGPSGSVSLKWVPSSESAVTAVDGTVAQLKFRVADNARRLGVRLESFNPTGPSQSPMVQPPPMFLLDIHP